jgi:hypothetical protein
MSRAPNARITRVVVLAAALTLAACVAGNGGSHRIGSAPYEQGSGTLASETRALPGFHAVSATRGIEVSVSAGESSAATVSGDDNLLAHVTTEVADGTLVVAVEGSIETRSPLRVEVVSATPIDAIAAEVGATLDCEDLQPDTLAVRASSGSSIRAGGRAGSIVVTADTGSTVDLRNVTTADARVGVSTGSTVHVHATDAVSGSCTLGSTLQLHGSPTTVNVAADAGSTVSD